MAGIAQHDPLLQKAFQNLVASQSLKLHTCVQAVEILKCLQTLIVFNLVFKFKDATNEISCIKGNAILNFDKSVVSKEVVHNLLRKISKPCRCISRVSIDDLDTLVKFLILCGNILRIFPYVLKTSEVKS
jgi:hypothetical protein